MKIKLIIFFSLITIIFFVPLISQAIPIPQFNLTVVVNTQGNDRIFHFDLPNNQGFNLQTTNLSASKSLVVYEINGYSFSETNNSGFKIASIFCTSNNPDDVFWYQSNSVNFSPTLFENVTCTFNNVKSITPVLIVPGVVGTELNKGSETLWADIDRMMADPADNFMDPLVFNKNITPSDSSIYISDVIKSKIIGSFKYDYTDNLIKEFENQGYVEGESLFTFPYDWRYGVSGKYADGSTNSDLLKNKIKDILVQTGSDKIDIVAHSMGGLIVKKYAKDNLTDNHIGKAVFVGVPETGAPKAVKALIQGDNFGVSFGPVGLSDAEMKKISENMPAAYDLLPSQKYYDESGSFVSKIDIGYGLGVSQPNETDLNYQDFENYLIKDKSLNSQALSNAKNLHTSDFDNFDLRTAGVDLYSINGCKTGTMTNFLEVRYKDILGNYHTEYDNILLKAGDGTVPMQSSTNLPIDQNKKYYALSSNHSKLLSADGSMQEIVNLISGSNLAVDSKTITQDINQCQLNGKVIEIFSPVDVSITDQFGNKMGLVNENITNEIPNANFAVLGEHKFVYLPTDNNQTYAINMQGTGTGTFTIKVKEIQNSQVVQTENFLNIPVTPALTGTINLSDSQSSLTVQSAPDVQPQTFLPTSIKNYDDFMSTIDATPPEAVIQFDPAKKDVSFLNSENGTVADRDDVVTLTDKSGNITEINLKSKNRKILMKAEIKSIKYNGMPADVSKNSMGFLWLYDKKGNLTALSQYVASKSNYNILAIYNGKNTIITGKDSSGKFLKTISGLKLIKITTNKGDLNWSY